MTTDAKFWDRIAEKYAAQPVADVPAFERKKAITREHLRPDSTVLEIGCGTGSLALDLARSTGHIHALDVSAEMVRIASQKKEAQRVANVTFQQGTLDGEAPFGRAQFDAVLAFSVLHLVPDRRRVLAHVFELLRPGGSFISSNVCLGGTWVPYGAIITMMRWVGKAPSVGIYDRPTMLREMREAGFIECQERDVGASKQVAFVVAKKPAQATARA